MLREIKDIHPQENSEKSLKTQHSNLGIPNDPTNMYKIIVCHFQQDCNVAESNNKLQLKCSMLTRYSKRL
jgi:hypothetical protein